VNNNANGNGVRRLLRPRMRGFTLGGFRFRFGIVFHALQHPAQVAAPPAPPAPRVETSPEPEPGTDPDPAVVRRYVAEVSASAMSVEQLAREGRLNLEQSRDEATEEVEQWTREDAESGGVDEENENPESTEVPQPSSSNPDEDPEKCKEKDETIAIENIHSTETNLTPCSGSSLDTSDQEIRSNRNPSDTKIKSKLDPSKQEEIKSNLDPSNQTEISSNLDSSDQAEMRSNLNPNDLAEMRSNLEDAAQEASDLLRDVQY
jgi:pyruvate/2-oxoglutarate dehydrogenase complex dihydrolipoamide acyltransferase (E2) component